ncbi:1313_t:CDS:2, partial [Funneliformis geosporum]
KDLIETSLKDNTSLISSVEVIFNIRVVSWHPCFTIEGDNNMFDQSPNSIV